MQPKPPGTWLSVLLLVAIVVAANAPLLDDFARLLRLPEVAASSADAATHYLRTLHARDYYLPSGHRLGWDPFWFQGYVPFLLYPHLTYVLVALVSMALPLEPARVFNAYTLAIYLALPLAAAFAVRRSLGFGAAAVTATWFSVLSTYGAGLTAVFVIGLLSQQVGVILFFALAYDLVIARRLDRAAIWLGLIPLVHVHASLLAAVAWRGAGLLAATEPQPDRRRAVSTWLGSSLLALLIGLPTLITLVQGWGQVGRSTTFADMPRLFQRMAEGWLLAPLPTLVAIVVCLVAAAVVVPKAERRRFGVWFAIAATFLVVSVHKWTVGVDLPDRVFHSMLYLRTLPFAFVWTALLAIGLWRHISRAVRIVVVVLSVFGVAKAWPISASSAERIGSSWRTGGEEVPESVADYRSALDWIARDVGNQTATLALFLPRPRALALMTAVERCRLPILGGHGAELTSIRNEGLLARTLDLKCDEMRRQARDYAVGYIVGTGIDERDRFEACFETPTAIERGDWWVFATGHRWETSPGTIGFRRDPTWTELEWKLRTSPRETRPRLPMANSAPWTADVDGTPVAIETTSDRMMRVTVPAGGKRLRLRYEGYRGEWASMALALAALVFAAVRARRRRSVSPS